MDSITNLKDKLVPDLPFDDVWNDKDEKNEPATEVGYIRADYDGYRWWNTCWHKHEALETPEIIAEIDAVYNAFKESFPDLAAMTNWCWNNASRTNDTTEFNAYYVGEHGCYWLRMITRRRDYNLYLHCFSKAAMKKEA